MHVFGSFTDSLSYLRYNKKYESLRLFQHTELEHTPKPLPTGYNGIPFIVGERGIAERVCDIGVCCNFLGERWASGWWFQTFFIFTPTWGDDPIWLIFFRWVVQPPTRLSHFPIFSKKNASNKARREAEAAREPRNFFSTSRDGVRPFNSWVTKKTSDTFPYTGCLIFNRDPYFMVYETIPT